MEFKARAYAEDLSMMLIPITQVAKEDLSLTQEIGRITELDAVFGTTDSLKKACAAMSLDCVSF